MFAAGTAVAATGYSKALGDDATTVSESSALSTTTPLPAHRLCSARRSLRPALRFPPEPSQPFRVAATTLRTPLTTV